MGWTKGEGINIKGNIFVGNISPNFIGLDQQSKIRNFSYEGYGDKPLNFAFPKKNIASDFLIKHPNFEMAEKGIFSHIKKKIQNSIILIMLYQMILFFLGLGMQNNFFIKIIMILYLMILGMPLKAKDLKSPNFIIVLADDLGWSSLSSTMDKKYPNAKSDYHKTLTLIISWRVECVFQMLILPHQFALLVVIVSNLENRLQN